MRVEVDDDRCRGHGVCLAVCPDVFTLTDDGYARPLTPEVGDEWRAAVTEAAEGCPEQAVRLG